jgi:hypothetical protein
MTPTAPRLLRPSLFLVSSLAGLLGCGAATDEPLPTTHLANAEAPPATAIDAPSLTAVHVSPLGDDDDDGSATSPVRSFVRAIELAREGSRELALCAGVFTEPLVLNAERRADLFVVRGGAACQGLSAAASIVRSATVPALTVFAVGGPVQIARVTFEHEGTNDPGASAIAAYVAYVDDVRLREVVLRAGPGAEGRNGVSATVAPCDAPFDPRDPTQVGRSGYGARLPGHLANGWLPAGGEDGGVLRFPRSSRCVEPRVQTGGGGGGGGASVALLARMTHVILEASTLTSSDAGSGGRGSAAQAPPCDPLTQKSCEVLDLGGGGGGAGGVSAAILHRQSVFDVDGASKLLHGAAGLGGAGGNGARWLHGTAGVAGVAGPFVAADEDDEGAVAANGDGANGRGERGRR